MASLSEPIKTPSQRSICVFCGSSPGNHPRYLELATQTGQAISQRQYRLVYGGGGFGLMGAAARAAHDNGGDVLGIIPQFLVEAEGLFKTVKHQIVPNMHVRKMQMYEESDAFIILPGGIGTLEEAVEIISWMRLQLHQKPIVFVSTDHYWRPLLDLIRHTIALEFTPSWLTEDIFDASCPKTALNLIEDKWQKPSVPSTPRPIHIKPKHV